MASGFLVGSTDLDDLFEPRESGDPTASNTGFRVGSTDLSQRYYPLGSGGSPIASSTGFRVGTTDLQDIFAAIDSVSTEEDFGGTYSLNSTSPDQQGAFTSLSMVFYSNGGWEVSAQANPLDVGNVGYPITGTLDNPPSGFQISAELISNSGDPNRSVNTPELFEYPNYAAPVSFGSSAISVGIGTNQGEPRNADILFLIRVHNTSGSVVSTTEVRFILFVQ